ncbi:MAG: hypothetical protein B1H04_03595 [Planctomycetales bacterium 4484_123]|nr:MAG: hypothetical protein B1H04_03595 [Planctomycetales bacterium 4484_123]
MLLLVAAFAALAGPAGAPRQGNDQPSSNLEYWLRQAQTTTAYKPPRPPATNPLGPADRFRRRDALPGVVVLSDGTVVPGGVYTTRGKNWEVWVEPQKRWRHIPPIVVLGIEAVVVEEGMEKEWRWKEMGSDEKVFTGREKPVRRLRWKFHLIDDSYITGTVKGQPLWVESPLSGKRRGPFILHERSNGKYGQQLHELVYVKKVIISRRAMQEVLKTGPPTRPARR